MPDSLQFLRFGNVCNMSLRNVTLLDCFLNLSNMALSGSLQSLSFWFLLKQSLENVAVPHSLQFLKVGGVCN